MSIVVVEGVLIKTGGGSQKHDTKKYSYMRFDTQSGGEVLVNKAMTDMQVDALVDPGVRGRFIFMKLPLSPRWLMGVETDDGRAAIHPFAQSKAKFLTTILSAFAVVFALTILMCTTPAIIFGLPAAFFLIFGLVMILRDTGALFDELAKISPARQSKVI